jgi:hypothetical protein
VVLQAVPEQAKPPWQETAGGVWQAPLAQVDCAMEAPVPEQLGPAPQLFVG